MKNTFESVSASRLDGGARPVAVVAPQRRSTNPGAEASSAAPSEDRAAAAAAPVSPVPSAGRSPTQLCGQASTSPFHHQANPPFFFPIQTVGKVPSIRINNSEDEDRPGNRSNTSTSASNSSYSGKSDELPRRSSSSSSSDSVLGGSSPSLLGPLLPSSQSPGRLSADYSNAIASCNFYYGTLTNVEAKSRLHRSPVGTFLLRDSSDRRFLYSLSVKTPRGTTSIRISGGGDPSRFRLDSDPNQKSQMPSFGSVLELVEHYHLGALASARDGAKQRRSHCVLLESSGRSDTPMVLRRPLETSPAPLAHLCRRLVNKLVTSETKRMALIERMAHVQDETKQKLKQYLLKYPFRV